MTAIHDQFTRQMRSRLKTTGMGLGLVRLLQDAGLNEEARATLFSLENGFHGVVDKSAKPIQAARKTKRLKATSSSFSFMSMNASHEFAH